MATVWKLLTVFLIATSCRVQAMDHEISSWCKSDMETCSQKTITRGRCRSIWNGFQLNNMRNDVNNDCQASGLDYAADISEDYDVNDDGYLCGDEWVNRRTSYGGLTVEYAKFEWNYVFSPDQYCMDASFFDGVPGMDLVTTFTNNNIARLVMFCNSSMNMMYNSDCWGLTYICKEVRADYEACQGFNKEYLTLSEKLMAKKKVSDPDMDGMVTASELRTVLNNKYDKDGNQCIDRQEWLDAAMNNYQFSEWFANAEFDNMLDGSSSCINTNNLPIPSEGVSVNEMIYGMLERLIQMCETGGENLYLTNRDCAMVVDTCLSHFPRKEACAIYVDNCGLQRYSSCINKLTKDSCMAEADRDAVYMETLRIDNQLKYYCTPNDGGAYMSGGQTTKVGYASLLLSFLFVTLFMYI